MEVSNVLPSDLLTRFMVILMVTAWKISIPLDNLDIVKVLTSNLNTSTIRN